jgi:hypothetical protein
MFRGDGCIADGFLSSISLKKLVLATLGRNVGS